MKSIKEKKVFWALLLVVLIGLVGWYAFNLNTQSSTSSINNLGINPSTINDKGKDTSDKLIYCKHSANFKEIYKVDTNGENKKLIFTDKDESDKIVKFGGLAYLSKEILVLLGTENIGKLALINMDGQKSVLIESFSANSFSITPDGENIAYVSFSNTERDYGYSLNTMTKNGENRRKIVQTDNEITSVNWNKDSSRIFYVSTTKDNKSEIISLDTETGKLNSIYSSSAPLYFLSNNDSGKITFSISTDNLNSGEIWKINSEGGEKQRLYYNKNALPAYGVYSSDELSLAFNLTTNNENFSMAKEGELTSAQILKNELINIKNIGNANEILGWLP